MTGEGVEAIIVMLVIILAIFKMVKRTGCGLGQTQVRDDSEKKEMDSDE
jgi:hypothetical protein